MTDFSKTLNDFFIKYLANQKHSSENTIKTYRDSFILLLEFMNTKHNLSPDIIKLADFSYELISEYLDWLEIEKKLSIATRNNRLAAIKSFFRYASFRCPEYINSFSSILTISKKKTISTPMNYLTVSAYQQFLSTFKMNEDLRDMSLIVLMYETGARVSEIINIKKCDVHISKPTTVTLLGKGNKIRIVPIDDNVASLLKLYMDKYKCNDDNYLFFNARKEKLTREGANYILQKHFKLAKEADSSLYPAKISPHCLRHSKAMHLLENGVNLIYIRDILGHSSVTTTEIYSKANPEIKRKHILQAANSINIKDDYSSEKKNELIDWLKNKI